MSSVEELYNKLKNDPEFIQKLADALVDKVVIKKLEEVIVEIARLREDQNKMREDFTKEMQKLREDQNKMREEFSQQITKLWEEQNKMREEFTREIIKLREDQNRMREEFSQRFLKIEEEQVRMREEFSKELIKLRREMNRYFKQVTALVDNITTTIEDDAQSFLEWLIQKELGYSVKVSRLEVEGLAEIDIFAEFGNYVLLGEVKSRANKNVLTDFMRKVEKLKMARPELFENKKSILVIFTLSPTYDLIQMCKEKKVFLTSGSRNFTEFKDSL
ncbi:MAG: DNA repair ATPase [Sulfolobaceae archaeon]|nr:DNA repair ATPase [Sulfolobaceae archaeon]